MRVRVSPRTVAFILLLALAAPPLAKAEDQKGPGVLDPKDPVLAPRPALVPAVRVLRPGGPLKLHTVPAGPLAKPENFTDQGLGLPPSPPTDRERAKLEAARVAVAAARATATTSRVAPSVDPAVPLHSAPLGKEEKVRLARPGAVPSDPALSGLPATPRSRQGSGPAVPTAREIEKLKSAPATPVTPEVQKESER